MEIAREPVESMNCFEAYPLAGFIFARRVKTLRGSLLMPVGERNEEKPLYPALGKRDETLPGKAVMPEAAIETGALLLIPVLWEAWQSQSPGKQADKRLQPPRSKAQPGTFQCPATHRHTSTEG